MADPYRDDRAALVAENQRLRRALERARGSRGLWPTVVGLGAHVVLRPLLDPWLNGTSDWKLWVAVAILGAPLVVAFVSLFRALRPAPTPEDSPWP
jgi:hypothetical protein